MLLCQPYSCQRRCRFRALHHGFPIGGSRPFAQRIVQRYEALGGALYLGAPVRCILVENDRAVGVEMEDGQRRLAGTVVSAADGHWTIFEAVGGRYVDSSICDLYDGKTLDICDAVVLVSLGVARSFAREPWLLKFPLPEPLILPDGTRHERMHTHIYNYDPTLAPAGKTVLTVTLYTRNYAYWTGLRDRDRTAYEAVKDDVARQVIDRLDTRLGDIRDKVEVIDVATPATFIRYTHNWQGSHMGWTPHDVKSLLWISYGPVLDPRLCLSLWILSEKECTMRRRIMVWMAVGLIGVVVLVGIVYLRDMQRSYERVHGKSMVISSPYGDIESVAGGSGPPVLVVHGSGGGYDQGELMIGALLDDRFHWIAPSRFGYLRFHYRTENMF